MDKLEGRQLLQTDKTGERRKIRRAKISSHNEKKDEIQRYMLALRDDSMAKGDNDAKEKDLFQVQVYKCDKCSR